MAETEEIWLSKLKFTRLQQPQQSNSDLDAVRVPGNPQTSSRQAVLTAPYQKPQECLAAEKPGGELGSEGVIWSMYLDEAKEHDSELVDGKTKNLDTMLLFAALFSAILTAFLIESKHLLQEDAADLSVSLLLAIAQSQQRVEQGTPQNLLPIQRPSFVAPLSARWINGLWFTALALSLAAALVAMLAKEWLAAFTASRPRPPKAHALSHQARLQGLVQWRALHLVDFLPTMLHLSLMLFFLGLAVYLWTLDSAIAIAEAIIAGFTLFFYVGTILLSAVYSSCPFVTQISGYLRLVLPTEFRGAVITEHDVDPDETRASRETSLLELRALRWLINNARDPAVGACACHSLAGIHVTPPAAPEVHLTPVETPITGGKSAESPPEKQADIEMDQSQRGSMHQPSRPTSERDSIIGELFQTVDMRLRQASLRLPQEPAESRGVDLVRYANVIPGLIYSIQVHPNMNWRASNRVDKPGLQHPVKPPILAVFDVLDAVWSDNCPKLGSDIYALLLAAELRIIEAVTVRYQSQVSVSRSPQLPTHESPKRPFTTSSRESAGEVVLDIPDGVTPSGGVSLFELRARYSRALARVGFILRYHNDRRAPLSAQSLTCLLESMRLAAQRADLNPEDHMSTCLPQSRESGALPLFQVLVNDAMHHWTQPLDIGDEDAILAGLVQVVATAGTQDNLILEHVAGRTLFIVGPMLLRQWVRMVTNRPQNDSSQYETLSQSVKEYLAYHWPGNPEVEQLEDTTKWTLVQLLVIASIAASHSNIREMKSLPNIAVAAFCRKVDTASGRVGLSRMDTRHSFLLSSLIRSALLHQDKLDSDTRKSLLHFLAVKHSDHTLFRGVLRSSTSPPHLLRLLAAIPNQLIDVQLILAAVQTVVQEGAERSWEANPYLEFFAEKPDGFAILTSISQQREYMPDTVKCITSIAHQIDQSVKRPRYRSRIFPPAIPSLLDAVQFVVEHAISGVLEPGRLNQFMFDVMSILGSLKGDSRVAAQGDPKISAICQLLHGVTDPHGHLVGVISELKKWEDHDSWLLEGLSQLFGDPFR
ncbi:hypothetical protein FRC10_011522 [Ceratobasidium sp. 414]|nr:hypothetical protein FRC10_011522 [Ceratobasidium sp. 414]